ncbi:VanZ family protein [Bacillus sp. FJAT-22090]|uniref:VanZ family protein n=1 Tax=Bacillus sp. FJAT-22090 TaxID=1581038 RepID=UPI0011A77A42|nr:VanZ family protein [Bacillus sp. FJAT-22090]
MKTAKNTLVSISFILYLFALVFILFLDSRGYRWSDLSFREYIKWSSNFIPFRTINLYVHSIVHGTLNITIPLKNLGGNLILFLPMGIYLPLYIKKLNKIRLYVITMTVLLLFIEVTQVVSRRGSFDIDDLILNMLGALIGFAIWNIRFVQK